MSTSIKLPHSALDPLFAAAPADWSPEGDYLLRRTAEGFELMQAPEVKRRDILLADATVRVGDELWEPSDAQLAEVADLFMKAAEDPMGGIVVLSHAKVEVITPPDTRRVSGRRFRVSLEPEAVEEPAAVDVDKPAPAPRMKSFLPMSAKYAPTPTFPAEAKISYSVFTPTILASMMREVEQYHVPVATLVLTPASLSDVLGDEEWVPWLDPGLKGTLRETGRIAELMGVEVVVCESEEHAAWLLPPPMVKYQKFAVKAEGPSGR